MRRTTIALYTKVDVRCNKLGTVVSRKKLTTPATVEQSTCRGEILSLNSDFETNFPRNVPLFLKIPNFFYKEDFLPKIISIRSAVSVEFRLVTDGRTHGYCIYRTSTASRGKKNRRVCHCGLILWRKQNCNIN